MLQLPNISTTTSRRRHRVLFKKLILLRSVRKTTVFATVVVAIAASATATAAARGTTGVGTSTSSSSLFGSTCSGELIAFVSQKQSQSFSSIRVLPVTPTTRSKVTTGTSTSPFTDTDTAGTNTRLYQSKNDNNNNNCNNNRNSKNNLVSWIDNMATNIKMIGGDRSLSTSTKTPTTTTPTSRLTGSLLFGSNGNEILLRTASTKIDSWDTIRTKYINTCTTDEEREFRTRIRDGTIASPMNTIRRWMSKNNHQDSLVVPAVPTSTTTSTAAPTTVVTFYRDSASWCPYCQKVWIALELLQIDYTVEKINMSCYGDKPRSFYQLQPNGQIPVATINGKTYRQSNDILQVLDGLSTNGKHIVPTSTETDTDTDREHVSSLLTLERQLFSTWLQWLTNGSGKQRFLDTLDRVEQELEQSNGPFFIGNSVSIVDIQFATFLERMVASMLYYKGHQIRYPRSILESGIESGSGTSAKTNTNVKLYPNINAWFDAMETIPAYQLTKSDYYTHCWDLPPQLGGCIMEPAGELYAAAINGEIQIQLVRNNNNNNVNDRNKGTKTGTSSTCSTTMIVQKDRTSWELPLVPDNGGIEPDWDPHWAGGDGTREVIERLSANYDAILQFAARGAGTKGFPSVSAPLADPRANPTSDPSVLHAVSLCMQLICMKLLDATVIHGADQSTTTSASTSTSTMEEQQQGQYEVVLLLRSELIQSIHDVGVTNDVIRCLSYLRDRVGVPRDMRLPAARQLRAHLNWIIQALQQSLPEG